MPSKQRQASLSSHHLPLAVCGVVLVYTTGYLLWYSGTPLGLYPVLDGREMLALAARIARHDLPAEPFYRAPLYPAVLAWLIKAGVAPQDLPLAARLLNGCLHLASSFLVWTMAAALWQHRASAVLAAALFGLNPVVLHFAGDPLDITFAITLMLAGLCQGLRALAAAAPRPPFVALGLAALLLVLAVITRPQMLMVLLAWLALVIVCVARTHRVLPALAAAGAPMLAVFGLIGAANYQLAGDFRVMPWQGAYNLWAANGPGANGRYFVQLTRIASYTEGINPARVESERLYQRLNPRGATDYASMSRFWYAKTVAAIAAEPWRWMRLLADKAYYLVNTFEQYDIKTYHVHKAASPWLRWNPLCWAAVFAAGLAGFAAGYRHAGVRAVALCALVYAAGLLLTYVSGRFRLPLIPLLAILAGGVVLRDGAAALVRRCAIVAAAAAASCLPLPPGEADKTVVQDHLLLSRAAAQLDMYEEAIDHARAALARAPGDEAARELVCVAAFNRWLRSAQRDAELPIAACEDAAAVSPVARRVLGIAYWRLGRDVAAVSLWQGLLSAGTDERDAALAALLMTDRIGAWYVTVDWSRSAAMADQLLLALALKGHPQAATALRQRMTADEIAKQSEHLERTFTRAMRD